MAIHREKDQSLFQIRLDIVTASVTGVLIGCVLTSLCFLRFNGSVVAIGGLQLTKSDFQIRSSTYKAPPVALETAKEDDDLAMETTDNLKRRVKELNIKLKQAEQANMEAENQVQKLRNQSKAGPFGSVKASPTNPTVLPHNSVNPLLANVLKTLAIKREVIVAIANSNVKDMLEIWFTNIKRVGISNYLVIALDEAILDFCKSNDVPAYRRNLTTNKGNLKFIVSGFKFQVLREFLQLGYSVLLSDVDIVFLQNPFNFLYRDSDIEGTTDGHDNKTSYGFNEFIDDPTMGQSTRWVYTSRVWSYNSGFFYIRPTIPSIELLDRVSSRLAKGNNLWDQAIFHEELYTTSRPGYDGLYASKRIMDFYLFMNSKVLFKFVRKDLNLMKNLRPVTVHVNYHSDKLERMKAIVDYYVQGNQKALDSFPDGSKE